METRSDSPTCAGVLPTHEPPAHCGPREIRGAAGLFLLTLWLGGFSAVGADPVRRTEHVATRDGITLATDIYLPAESGSYPVVLIRTPYNKDMAAGLGRDGTTRGYAIVAQDTRGRFASKGENLPFHRDVPDGADTLAWLAKQPWCNGRIGTWGGSAGAITQFHMAAAEDRPAIAAQFLIVGAPDLYDVVYTGGIFRKSLIEDWLRGTKFATNALSIWESHPRHDAYWAERDASRHYARMDGAGVHVGGWWDIFAQPTIDAFVGYQTAGRESAGRQKLIMGPWAHNVLQEGAGELRFPNGKNPVGDTEDPWRWFDRWLKDADNQADQDPAVTYYVLGDVDDTAAPGNVWRTAATWPPVSSTPTRYFLHSNLALSPNAPTAADPLSYVYHPTNPVPTRGGIQLTIPAGPMDQRPIESRPDVLVFTSEPLEKPLEVTGRVRARLWVASDAPDTDFFVRLCDVYPDGRSFNLTEGMLRTRFRRSPRQEQMLIPGQAVPLDIDVWSTSVVFNRGHRIRVHVTSSSAPGFDPNPNTGEDFRSSPRVQPANNQVFVDPRHASCIVLPVVNAAN